MNSILLVTFFAELAEGIVIEMSADTLGILVALMALLSIVGLLHICSRLIGGAGMSSAELKRRGGRDYDDFS